MKKLLIRWTRFAQTSFKWYTLESYKGFKTLIYRITDLPVVVNAEEAGDEDAEDEEDDAGSGDDDHRPRRADHITLFKISLNKNWEKTVF